MFSSVRADRRRTPFRGGLDRAERWGDPIITRLGRVAFDECSSAASAASWRRPRYLPAAQELVDAIVTAAVKVGIDREGVARSITTVVRWTAGRMSAESAASTTPIARPVIRWRTGAIVSSEG